MLIYLLRHGQTEYNAQKRYQGQRDIPLSPEGAAQLRRADFDPDVVYVSTLQRTSQTARILFPEAKLVPVDGLKEMCFGSFEGRNFIAVSYTHLRAHETDSYLVCRLLLEKKKKRLPSKPVTIMSK